MNRLLPDRSQYRVITTVIVISTLALLVLRMVVVSLWTVIGGHTLTERFWIELLLTVTSDLILVGIIGVVFMHYAQRAARDMSYELLASALSTYAISALCLLLLGALLPGSVTDDRPGDVVTVVTSHLLALGTFIVSISLAGFLAWFLQLRRHKRTRLYLAMTMVIILGIWLLSALGSVNEVFSGIGVILAFFGSLVMLLNVKRLHWLATLTMDKKIRLMWLTMCAAFASAILASWHAFNDSAFVTQSAGMFIRSGAVLPSVINLFGFVFFVRLLVAVIASLPNSGIVDRRSSEVESLAYLTRMMAETADVETLLRSVTQFALQVCRAHGAWCELYEEDEPLRIVGATNVHSDYVMGLHQNRQLHRLFLENNGPVLVDSVQDTFGLDGTLGVRSLITVPLVRGHRRTGTLVMFSTIEYGFEADDLRLLTAFGDAVSIALDQTRLMETAIEKERLQKEFDVARRIQSSLLPTKPPSISSVELAAVTIPAEEIGGDYYDYVRFENGRPGVIIADVSGKGIPAALYMATLKGVVLAEIRSSSGPADLLKRINAALMGSMERQTYITMMAVDVDEASMTVRVARAGHTPLIYRHAGSMCSLAPKGMAIGLAPPSVFDSVMEESTITISRGDVLLLTTDGVNERRNRMLDEIGMEAVSTMLSDMPPTSASAMVVRTLDLLELHGEGTDQHDDITIVAMVVTADDETHQPAQRSIEVSGAHV